MLSKWKQTPKPKGEGDESGERRVRRNKMEGWSQQKIQTNQHKKTREVGKGRKKKIVGRKKERGAVV